MAVVGVAVLLCDGRWLVLVLLDGDPSRVVGGCGKTLMEMREDCWGCGHIFIVL